MSHLNTFHLYNSTSVAWTRGRSPILETYPTHFFLLIATLIHFHRAQVDSAVKPRWARPASNSRCTSSCFISSTTARARRRQAILRSPHDYQARLCPVVTQSKHLATKPPHQRVPELPPQPLWVIGEVRRPLHRIQRYWRVFRDYHSSVRSRIQGVV